ncbi:hypothetical protein AH547_09735 [Salmonella enterica subsp. enterica]|nr:hypothetical protein [Salmonella enterica]ECC3449534.1 hypothetical protein [Salmonella enterica subsp. enterica serovar Javiana]ECH9478873.1 hypothetical protein [Salmonella enterica subsp. enterica]EDW6387248.1 hypothetical protein [Salmonella enterica subsp. enterica serovar Java]
MMVQNQNNPLAPATGPSADQLLNAYEQKAAALRGEAATEAAPTGNPFGSNAAQSQQDQQSSHISAMEQFLAPIGMNKYSVDSDYTDEKHQRFAKNLSNDPAFQEFESPLNDYLSSMRGEIAAGRISPEDAIKDFAQWGQTNLDPILHKHHGPHSESHKTTLHDEEPLAIPESIRRARGGK